MASPTRNFPREFAQRTIKNLNYIEHARIHKQDVHSVTQIANSLLGLVLFPWEESGGGKLDGKPVFPDPEWIRTDKKYEKPKDLSKLVVLIRNGIAHRHLSFLSDDPDPKNVPIEITSYKCDQWGNVEIPKTLVWQARMSADQVLLFCERLLKEMYES